MDKKLLEYIDYDSSVALIPARGGSKSVPKKNIRLIQQHPLIAYSIAVAKLSQNIDRVIVSTDSEEIAKISRQYGAEVPFLRPAEYAQDDSPDIDCVRHVILWLYENECKIPRYFLFLRPTSPIRNPIAINEALKLISQDENATSIRSGHICVHPPFKWFKKEGTYLEPLMPNMTCDEVNLPRQGFPEVYIPNGYVDILKTDFIIQSDLMYGDRLLVYKTEEIPDIDSELDLRKLELYEGLKESFEQLLNFLEKVNEGDK